jgi:hypothetical protein
VQVDPIKYKLKAPGTNLLALNFDELLSTFAFKVDLSHHTKEREEARAAELTAVRAAGLKHKTLVTSSAALKHLVYGVEEILLSTSSAAVALNNPVYRVGCHSYASP